MTCFTQTLTSQDQDQESKDPCFYFEMEDIIATFFGEVLNLNNNGYVVFEFKYCRSRCIKQ